MRLLISLWQNGANIPSLFEMEGSEELDIWEAPQ
jgi:hypothetical protein